MSVALKAYIFGSAGHIQATILQTDSPLPVAPYPDPNCTYIDPDSNEVDIFDDDGAQVLTLTTTIVRDGLGLYHVDFALPTSYDTNKVPEVGKWSALWLATYGSLISKVRTDFNVTN
jgi:hypothetical protein